MLELTVTFPFAGGGNAGSAGKREGTLRVVENWVMVPATEAVGATVTVRPEIAPPRSRERSSSVIAPTLTAVPARLAWLRGVPLRRSPLRREARFRRAGGSTPPSHAGPDPEGRGHHLRALELIRSPPARQWWPL